jgi:nitrite reductase/ring-hydroxylating ferredoxin subunit
VKSSEPLYAPELVCEDWAVEPGTARRVVLRGRALAVFNVGGEFYVTDDTCTHGLASLAEGTLEGSVVTCPWHGGRFDVRTGRPVAGPCTEPLATYPCRVRDEGVWIESTP